MKIMGVERNEDLMPPVNCGERHVAVIILVDISGSMSGKPIEELNQGLIEFRKALEEDSLAMGKPACILSLKQHADFFIL